jgi:hypothetical protein
MKHSAMRFLFLILTVLSSFSLFAAGDVRFNGRWDITANRETHNAWWLEITGAETDQPAGKFVGFGGNVRTLQRISITPGEITFGFDTPGRAVDKGPRTHLNYKAKLVGNRLEGTFQAEGGHQPPVTWAGVRAPLITDKDDGSWHKGKPVMLFNGKDLTGWKTTVPTDVVAWSAGNGVLSTTGKGENIASGQKFWNFILHAEFKPAAHANSGIGLRGRYEVQILDDYGHPPDTHGNGALYARILPSENASKPAGEWQTYDIRLVGRQVTIVLNGKKVIDKGEVEGLTAIAIDPHEAEPGPIVLQGDHGPVQFRNIVVTPLVK